MIEIELAFPPSVNHYWGTKVMRRANRSTISRYVNKPGKIFRTDTIYRCAVAKLPRAVVGKLRCEIDLYPPDKRIRDCDNYPKSILDALVHAGIMRDDSQIVELIVRMCAPVKQGRTYVTLKVIEGEQ